MDEVPRRETLQRQYFAFHNIHAHGKNSAQVITIDELIQLGRHYLSSVLFGERFVYLDFKSLLADAFTGFRNPGPLIVKKQIKAGILNLEKYGLNLCHSPWRKEFLVVKLYSGFYKCNVESNFKPARTVLEMFGYRETSPEELSIVDTFGSNYFEGRQHSVMDKIKEIVFELFLMSVELTVLVPILDFAEKEGYSLEDALKSRRRTKGDFQEAKAWLEKNARNSFAPKRRKFENELDSMASLREDYPTLKGNWKGGVSGDNREEDEKSEDVLQRHRQFRDKYSTRTPTDTLYVSGNGPEEDEKSEDALQRHQHNREKYGTRTTSTGVRYPPGSRTEAGLNLNERQQYRSRLMDSPSRGASGSGVGELVHSTAGTGYGGETVMPFMGYELDDAELYGHSGSGTGFDHDPSAMAYKLKIGQGFGPPFSTTVVTPKITYDTTVLQPKKTDVPTGDYVPMVAFLNTVESTDEQPDQDQTYDELWKCDSGGTPRVVLPPYTEAGDPPPPYSEKRESDDYVVIESPGRNMENQMKMEKPVPSKSQTPEPYQYLGQARSIDPSENLRFSNKESQYYGRSGYGYRNRDVSKDDMSALNTQIQDRLSIQRSSLPYNLSAAPRDGLRRVMTDQVASAVTSRQDKTYSALERSKMALHRGATRNKSKQPGGNHRDMYSPLPDHKPTTGYRENDNIADPTNVSWLRFSDSPARKSTDYSVVSTRQTTLPSNDVSSYSNSSYSSPRSTRGNPPVSSLSSVERSSVLTTAQSLTSSMVAPSYSNDTNQETGTEKNLLGSKSSDAVGNVSKRFPQIPTSKDQSFDASSSSGLPAHETELAVHLQPLDTKKKESFAEKETKVPEEPNKHSLRSSSSNLANQGTVCDHCKVQIGSSICRNCFKISCNVCQEIFDTDLCPKGTKGKDKGPHSFIRLSSKKQSRNKLADQSSHSSERAPAGTSSSDDQPDGPGMEEWNCERCTMLNPANNTVCCACATTRGLEEPTPSKPGSSVCGKCTYHNQEGAQVCEVCHGKLDRIETCV